MLSMVSLLSLLLMSDAPSHARTQEKAERLDPKVLSACRMRMTLLSLFLSGVAVEAKCRVRYMRYTIKVNMAMGARPSELQVSTRSSCKTPRLAC